MFEWDQTFSVHVEEIDEQHKKIITMCNALEDSTKSSDFAAIIPEILQGLKSYVWEHFDTEEKLMEIVNYPDIEEHKAIHASLKISVEEEFEKFMAKELTALDVMYIHNYLKNWVKNHILEVDMKYTTYIK